MRRPLPKQYLPAQLRATSQLVTFINDHNGAAPEEILLCLSALESDDIDKAVKYAKKVKPFGMGSLTDWVPDIVSEKETDSGVEAELDRLVRSWCDLMSRSFPEYS